MEIQLKDGVYHLTGKMDEYVKFDSLLAARAPLKLNIGKISSINSIGVRKFLAFTLVWAPRKFEFYECTPEFISNVNVIPQMLGTPSDDSQIKSFNVPYHCTSCKRATAILYDRSKLRLGADRLPILPDQPCPRCSELLHLDAEKIEYFVFLRPDET